MRARLQLLQQQGRGRDFATLPVPRNRTPQPSRVQQQCLFVCLFGCILLTPQARWLSVQAGCHSCGTAGRVRMHARMHGRE